MNERRHMHNLKAFYTVSRVNTNGEIVKPNKTEQQALRLSGFRSIGNMKNVWKKLNESGLDNGIVKLDSGVWRANFIDYPNLEEAIKACD